VAAFSASYQKKRPAWTVFSFSGIGLFLVCSTQEIIYTDTIEISQFMQRCHWYIQPAQLIIRVGGLVNFQKLRQLLLCLVGILPQIPKPVIVHMHHRRYYAIREKPLSNFKGISIKIDFVR